MPTYTTTAFATSEETQLLGRVAAGDHGQPLVELYRLYRISAGTFHPDENGRSRVRLAAAVDPAKYGRLAVTAEPGDGNPAPNGPDVLRSRPEERSAQP